jgi:hypothetical protein
LIFLCAGFRGIERAQKNTESKATTPEELRG